MSFNKTTIMKNLADHDDEDQHDYSPNELAEMSRNNRAKYNEIVQSNLNEGDTIEDWENRNRAFVQRCLSERKPSY